MSTVDIGVTRERLDLIDRRVQFMYKVLDHYQIFKEISKIFEWYPGYYSTEAKEIVRDIHELAVTIHINRYATYVIFFGCCRSLSLDLGLYLRIFDRHNQATFRDQRELLLCVLHDDEGRMRAAQREVEEIIWNMNFMHEKLNELVARLAIDYHTEGQFFKYKVYRFSKFFFKFLANRLILPKVERKFAEIMSFFENLQKRIADSNADISNTKVQIDADLVRQDMPAEPIEHPVPLAPLDMYALHDDIVGSVNNVINRCEELVLRSDFY